jgi:very-short-patch-repair endonuclease
MWIPKYISEIAKWLRNNMTEAEKLLWEKLRRDKLQGKRFLRQKPINVLQEDSWLQRYVITDFICFDKKLVIELDGNIHDREDLMLLDKEKEELLKNLWFQVLRFQNTEIHQNIDKVLEKIAASCLS